MKLTTPDLLRFGIIDGIIPEPAGGAQNNLPATDAAIKELLRKELSALQRIPISQLIKSRGKRLQNFGIFRETARDTEEGPASKFLAQFREKVAARFTLT